MCERSNLPQKSPTVLYEPKFGPPNQKFLDPLLGEKAECDGLMKYGPFRYAEKRRVGIGWHQLEIMMDGRYWAKVGG